MVSTLNKKKVVNIFHKNNLIESKDLKRIKKVQSLDEIQKEKTLLIIPKETFEGSLVFSYNPQKIRMQDNQYKIDGIESHLKQKRTLLERKEGIKYSPTDPRQLTIIFSDFYLKRHEVYKISSVNNSPKP